MERGSNHTELESELAGLSAVLELANDAVGDTFIMPASQYNLFATIHTLATEKYLAQADPTTAFKRDRIIPLAQQRERFDDPITVQRSQLNRMQAEIVHFSTQHTPDYSSLGSVITGSANE